MSSLEEKILNTFNLYTTDFEHNENDLQWLLKNPEIFTSSYQHLNSFGPNRLIRFANRYIPLCGMFFKKKFFKHVKSTIQSNYFNPIELMGYPLDQNNLNEFYSTFYSLHHNHWSAFRKWDFAYYFSFLQQCCHELFQNNQLPIDLYHTVKQEQNKQFSSYYNVIREAFFENNLSFSYLCYLVVRANWVDSYEVTANDFIYNFSKEMNEVLDNQEWVNEFIKSQEKFNFYALHNAIKGAPATFLYECDNNGEIYLDLILIEYILKNNHTVYLCTKLAPILNDVLTSDIQEIFSTSHLNHFDEYVKSGKLNFISNNSKDAITLRNKLPKTYQDIYSKSNYVILKGQGHFESYPIINTTRKVNNKLIYNTEHFYLFGLKSSFTQTSLNKLGCHLKRQSLVLARSYEFIT